MQNITGAYPTSLENMYLKPGTHVLKQSTTKTTILGTCKKHAHMLKRLVKTKSANTTTTTTMTTKMTTAVH